MRSFVRAWVAVLGSVGLAACGGGGGADLVALNQTNAPAAASQVSGVTEFLLGLTDVFGDVEAVFAAGSGSHREPCEGGGHADAFVQDLAPFREASVGDSASLTFRGCAFDLLEETFTLNGGLSFRVTALTRNGPDDVALTLAVTLRGLSFSAPGFSLRADGSYTLQIATEDGETFTTVVTGASVTVSGQVDGEPLFLQATNFRIEGTVNDATGEFAYAVQGRLASRDLGGAVDCATVTPLQGTAPGNPSAGEVVLSGANGCRVRLLALDEVNVRLFVDADGDGIYETTIDTTWDELGEADA